MTDDLVARVKAALKNNEGSGALAALRSPSPPAPAPVIPDRKCLLLDISGSMAEECEPGRSKWDALRSLLPQFALVRSFAFNDAITECRTSALPFPCGGTDMAGAFAHLKEVKFGHAILITDGLPNDESAALREVHGLRLDIFYVGPPPRPPFLDRLAAATGGSIQTASLKSGAAPRLAASIRTMLALPPGDRS